MGKILSIVAALLLTVGALVLPGCNTAGCTELRSSVPRADFYSAFTEQAIALDSLTVVGIGAPGDSAMLRAGTSAKYVYLPMNAATDTVSWRITYAWEAYAEEGIADTITMRYDRRAWFAGEECGAMFRYRITNLQYTRNLIDTVLVVDSLVTNEDLPTLSIYFNIES